VGDEGSLPVGGDVGGHLSFWVQGFGVVCVRNDIGRKWRTGLRVLKEFQGQMSEEPQGDLGVENGKRKT